MRAIVVIFLLMNSMTLDAQTVNFLRLGKYRVSRLSDRLKENSGLTFQNGQLFTINDGGNAPELYRLDPASGKILQIIEAPLKNIDWEAVASDSTHLYIGDFGNNAGSRRNLTIYKLPSDSIITTSSVQTIDFYYPEQTDYRPKIHRNDYDAEAMIYLNGKLHIFTKEWAANATTHYTVDPEIAGRQAAKITEHYKNGYLVTDAAYHDRRLYLIGYTKKAEVFLSVFNESKPGIFFEQNPEKYYLGSAFSVGQAEGIAVNKQGVYISAEAFRSPVGQLKPSLYFIPFNKIKTGN